MEEGKAELVKFPIISIDPGFDNLASIKGYYSVDKENNIITIHLNKNSFNVVSLGKQESLDIPELNRRIRTWIYQSFDDRERRGGICLIEQQYVVGKQHGGWWISLKLNILSSILFTLFDSKFEMLTMLVPSRMVKKYLNLNKRNYGENKKAVFEWAKEICPKVNNHHIADCLAQMVYWLVHNYGKNNQTQFNFNVEYNE